MSYVAEQPIGLIEKLRVSERLADRIVKQGLIHADPRTLRRALDSDGSTVHAVLKNWIFGMVETRPEQFHNVEEAERFVERALRARMLEAFPDACNL